MIEFIDVAKIYKTQTAVEDISFKIDDGEFVCLIGTSGSGKTTIMRMINRMTEPSKGKILIDGEDIMTKNPVQLRREIGYVIQQIGLLPHMTIYENITLVPTLLKWDEEKKRKIAEELIKKVDLPVEYLEKYPSQLSGGQQQRVPIARAFVDAPPILFADEPTGNLDTNTSVEIMEMMCDLAKEHKQTLIIVTHDLETAVYANRIVELRDGKIVRDETQQIKEKARELELLPQENNEESL